ncbi:MAG: hydroxyacid dehydrogenase [Kiritimatiellia bacterium]|jgi:D-3-phosphoglycerate dehydrogenase|nr:hydroxyacid dehydrogenase [Kiritimatiellia bacterium]
MKKVLIPTALDPVAKEILEARGDYEVVQMPKMDILQFARENPDLHALIVRSEKITPDIIDAAPALKVIVRAGAGYNTIDIHYARQKGIDVMNTPGANSNGVAEEVVALMLADARHLVAADASCRCGKWEKSSFMGTEITGKTIGIVGLGHIGKLVAKRVSGFEMKVLGYDPKAPTQEADLLGIELVGLPELFTQSDYVSLHLPENDKTRGMINRDLLGLMKTGATLINCARSGVVHEDDLRAFKAEKNLRFLNDVYPKDAEGPKSVADMADIMAPHLGANTIEANRKAAELAAHELIALDTKGTHPAIVNKA